MNFLRRHRSCPLGQTHLGIPFTTWQILPLRHGRGQKATKKIKIFLQ